MAKKKTRAQHFMQDQLKDPQVAASFYAGLEELRVSVKIAQLRQKRGLTQTELAARFDIVLAADGRFGRRSREYAMLQR